jgi:hypothetical protein
VWKYTTNSYVYSSPAVANGVVYVGSYDYNVYAFGPFGVTFYQTGVSADFTGTVLTVDGTGYGVGDLPVTFVWNLGSSHTFAFQSPLVVTANSKQYVWTSTSGLSTQQSGNITVSTAGNVTGNYKTQYYLAVVSPYDTPGGMGWYDAGATAYATLAYGTQTIVPGWVQAVFTGWSGDATGTNLTSNSITMNGAKTAVANWEIQYYLEVVSDPSLIPPMPGANWYNSGTDVELTAVAYYPNSTGVAGVRYRFDHWDVDGTAVSGNPIDVYMGTNHTATAHYIIQYYLTLTTSPVSGINTPTGEGWYDGETYASISTELYVDIVAGSSQWGFTGWTTPTMTEITNSSATSTTVLMDNAKTITGNYVTQYYLTLATSPSGVNTPTGEGWYDNGTYASISTNMYVDIVPGSSRWSFSGWTTDYMYEVTDPSFTSTTVLMDKAKTVTANYVTQYNVTFDQTGVGPDFTDTVVIIDGTDYGVSGLPASFWWDSGSNHSFAFQSPLSVTPSAKQYVWVNTTGLSTLQSDPITVSTAGNVTGNYKTQYYLAVVSPYDTPGGMGWYDAGATAYATLAYGTQTIVPGWVQAVFTGWSGDATGTGLTSDPITMDGPKTAIADWVIQYYLSVVTSPPTLPPIPGADWYNNCTWVSLTAPQYVPSEAGLDGVRYSFTYWDVDGASQGVGVNPIDVYMDTYHVATAYFTLQYLFAFNQTGVGSDFSGTVVVIDGSNYNVTDLPASFWYDDGTTHSFAFQSPLLVGSGAKQYDWISTSGLLTSQSGSIFVSASGSVTGNYVTKIHDVAVTNVVANCTWVYQGWQASINVTVENNGDFPETVAVTLYYNITAGQTVGTQIVSLPVGESNTTTFIWNTGGVQYCHNYTMTAVASVPLDVTPADNTLADGNIKVRILGDVNGDGKIDLKDIAAVAKAFGAVGPAYVWVGRNYVYHGPSPNWNPFLDLNQDGKIDIRDIVIVAKHFGLSCPA